MQIRLENVTKSWSSADRSFCLHVPHFELVSGQVVVLTGENGTGKTTLMEVISLATAPSGGAVTIETDARALDVAELWRVGNRSALASTRAQHFGYVLQSIHLLPFLSVRENAEWSQKIAERPDPSYLAKLLQALGLEGREDALPDTLSPGLRQRTAVARALAHRPNFVIADEPTAALDPVAGDTVRALLLDLALEQGTGIIMSTHNRDVSVPEGAVRVRTEAQEPEGDRALRAELVYVS